MTIPAAKLTVITIGVRNVPKSGKFYEALGFRRKMRKTRDEIVFLDGVGLVIALWDWNKLADDAIVEGEPRPETFRGVTLAWNCATPEEVDAVFTKAIDVGARILRGPSKTDYGGYRGYFADPDDHVWEVVYAPGFGFDGEGRLTMPD
jgi:predicted lactoylglutathione lyase